MADDSIPDDLQYTKDHEWIAVDGNIATVGITDHAQGALGDLVFVELPEVGAELEKGDEMAVVESVKAASEVYAPLSGEVIEVNEALNESPETINDSPYDDGWIAKIKIRDKGELDETMDAEAYGGLIDEEEAA